MAKSIRALRRHRVVTISRLLTKAYYLNARGRKDEMYNLIGDELFKLGGVYIKFLQGVVLQSWMMHRWRSKRKLDIFTKIDQKQLDAPTILRKNLGKKLEQLSDIGEEPFAIGSFGHVYKATLEKNKKPVIIKILSPEIRQTLKFDLKLLKFFWYFHLRSIKFNKSFNLQLIFEDFKKQTLKEIDYVTEAEFAHQQYMTYQDHPKLVIPRTYLDLCTPEIIVQDYIDGLAVADLLKLKEENPRLDLKKHVKEELGSDMLDQLQVLAYEIIWGAFHHPLIMGDPHPGNVILLKDDKIALIDFGIMAKSSQNPAAFLKFIKAYHSLFQGEFNPQEIFAASFQFFGRDLYLALSKLNNLLPNDKNKIDLNQELAKIVKNTFEAEYPGKDVKKLLMHNPKALIVFDRLANKHNRFGFKLKVHDVEMLRTLVTLTGLVDLMGLYTQVMEPTYGKVIERVNKVYPDLQSLNDMEISHSQALNIAFTWLERMAARDPGLFKTIMAKTHLRRAKELIKDNKKPADRKPASKN